ncbi:Gfo/Idh/MocA family oxidoreductase [Paludisphaera sp.]|uniref:Gfo/Idh/MocA family protein n=1 Tax=Paludisphaera sp. TaxID=2017432 RepID=UPI00301E03E9
MTNRRDALKLGAAGLTASMLGGYVHAAADEKTYRVGLIGCGWYGKSDLFRLIQVAPVEVVSVCDPDDKHTALAAEMVAARQKSGNKPRTFRDYREMLKDKDLDIVLVATPDHWHALAMIAAVEAGADVYVQKPISHDVLEGEAMVAAARKHGRVVQVGTQRKSTPHLIRAKKEVVEAGLLGKIGHVEVCCYYHMRHNDDPPVTTPPDFLDYDLWSGPAPLRPYDGLPHLRWWRTFMEYGSGITGDMCVHMLDTARWMLGLGWPEQVTSSGGIIVQKGGKSNISDTQVATFEYPEYDVVWQHRTWGTAPDPDYPWALFIYGEKGTLKASTMRADFIPQGEGKPIHFDCVFEREQYPEDVNEPDIELNAAPATRLHMRNFLDAIASRGRPVADIEEGHISTASCLLANIAMQLSRPVAYDPAKRIIAGDDEATKLLRAPYRAPWVHPADTELA